ncbi:hypothetical protein D3C78_647760 [compost metagenome]
MQTRSGEAVEPWNLWRVRSAEGSRGHYQRLGEKLLAIGRVDAKHSFFATHCSHPRVRTDRQLEALGILFEIAHHLVPQRVVLRFSRERHAR